MRHESSRASPRAPDRADQARASRARRSPSRKLVGAVQRVWGGGMPVQGLSSEEARALLSAELHAKGKGDVALRASRGGRHRPTAAEELRPAASAGRCVDRCRHGARDSTPPTTERTRGGNTTVQRENLILSSFVPTE